MPWPRPRSVSEAIVWSDFAARYSAARSQDRSPDMRTPVLAARNTFGFLPSRVFASWRVRSRSYASGTDSFPRRIAEACLPSQVSPVIT